MLQMSALSALELLVLAVHVIATCLSYSAIGLPDEGWSCSR